jgi:hypothetical protein
MPHFDGSERAWERRLRLAREGVATMKRPVGRPKGSKSNPRPKPPKPVLLTDWLRWLPNSAAVAELSRFFDLWTREHGTHWVPILRTGNLIGRVTGWKPSVLRDLVGISHDGRTFIVSSNHCFALVADKYAEAAMQLLGLPWLDAEDLRRRPRHDDMLWIIELADRYRARQRHTCTVWCCECGRELENRLAKKGFRIHYSKMLNSQWLCGRRVSIDCKHNDESSWLSSAALDSLSEREFYLLVVLLQQYRPETNGNLAPPLSDLLGDDHFIESLNRCRLELTARGLIETTEGPSDQYPVGKMRLTFLATATAPPTDEWRRPPPPPLALAIAIDAPPPPRAQPAPARFRFTRRDEERVNSRAFQLLRDLINKESA